MEVTGVKAAEEVAAANGVAADMGAMGVTAVIIGVVAADLWAVVLVVQWAVAAVVLVVQWAVAADQADQAEVCNFRECHPFDLTAVAGPFTLNPVLILAVCQ
jgi:hypothetical protein